MTVRQDPRISSPYLGFYITLNRRNRTRLPYTSKEHEMTRAWLWNPVAVHDDDVVSSQARRPARACVRACARMSVSAGHVAREARPKLDTTPDRVSPADAPEFRRRIFDLCRMLFQREDVSGTSTLTIQIRGWLASTFWRHRSFACLRKNSPRKSLRAER